MLSSMMLPLFFNRLGGWEMLIIFLVVLLLFGGRKIPELMRGLGKGIHSFRKGMQEAKDEMNRPVDDDDSDNSDKNSRNTEPTGKDRG